MPRILVEWICSECNAIHRISFPYIMKSLMAGIRVKWGKRGTKRGTTIKKLELDYGISLSELNDFITSLFQQKFKAINYVKIAYPKRLLSLLEKNEQNKKKPPELEFSPIRYNFINS